MVTKITNTLTSGSSAKLRDFSKKFERPAPPEGDSVPTPAPRDNIFERMDLANKLEHDNSLDDVIDVFPDTRFPLIFIIFNVMKIYKSVTEERPLLTPASMVSYCLFQLYAFALINDYYGRPSPSSPATQFMNDDLRAQLLEILCLSYVPPFMLTLFHALADCSDPRRPGLQYFCTLAGSRFANDFGRYITPATFIHMHNISTDEDTSRTPATAMLAFLNHILFNTETNNRPVRVMNYFSAGATATTYHASWLYQAVRTLFSPVTGKSLLRRTNIQHIPTNIFTIHTAPAAGNLDLAGNAYCLYLNASSANARHTLKFISAMSNIIKNDFKGVFQLGAVPDDLNGVNVLVHGYSFYALPTWQDLRSNDAMTGLTTSQDDSTYATTISFMRALAPTVATDRPYPRIDTAHPLSFISGLYAQANADYDADADPDHNIPFNESLHVAPRTVYLDPYTNGDGPISYSLLAGLIIESTELDGSSVPMPNPATGLSMINRDFLQGSVPMSRIHRSWHPTASAGIDVLPRTVMKRQYQKISHDLYAIESNRLGRFTKQTSGAIPLSFYGFDIKDGIHRAIQMFSKFSFSTSTAPTATDFNFVAWSPYRYVMSDNDEHPNAATTYMLLNFRTIYGTHIPLVASRHPSVIIPIS